MRSRRGVVGVGGMALLAVAVGAADATTVAHRARHGARPPVAAAATRPITPLPTQLATPVPVPVATLRAPAPAPIAVPAAVVRPLTALVSPDLLVTGPASISSAQLAAVRRLVGVTSVVPVAAGTVRLGSQPVTVLGADPSVFRTVTPAPTAASDALWQSVARGEVLSTYATSKAQHLALGRAVPVGSTPRRIGSFADLRMPGVGAVVDPAVARQLHLVPQAGLVVTAPSRDVLGLERDLVAILRPERTTAAILRLSVPTSGHATMSAALYKAAARTCPGLSWSVLAAIGGIESGHGADTAVSPAGAEGPMQFLPSTFAGYAVDGDRDGQARIDDPADAVFTAARLLCDDGAARGGSSLYSAIFDYNHADWYVAAVQSLAARYAAAR